MTGIPAQPPRRLTLRTIIGAVIRCVVILGLAWLSVLLAEAATGPSVGANIGAGLLGILVILVGSFVWAVLDGRRRGTGALPMWAIVAALYTALMLGMDLIALRDWDSVPEGVEYDWGATLSSVTFGACFALLACLGGVAVGTALGGRRRPA